MVHSQTAQYAQETVVEYYREVQSPYFIALDHTTLTDSSKETLSTVKPSGIVLFTNNIISYKQTKTLIQDIHNYGESMGISIKVAIDEEGGVVSRLNHLPEYPDYDGYLNGISKEEVQSHAQFLSELGIDINLGPVADIAYTSDSIMKLRSAGNTPEKVSEGLSLIIDVQKQYEVASTLKHFPGHGRTPIDSHQALPTINISKDTWLKTDALPFIEGINKGTEYIMPGHLLYPQIDSILATYSDIWNKGVVRNELNYKGLLISDDLKMHALEESYALRTIKTLDAGINYPLLILKEKDMTDTYTQWLEMEQKRL